MKSIQQAAAMFRFKFFLFQGFGDVQSNNIKKHQASRLVFRDLLQCLHACLLRTQFPGLVFSFFTKIKKRMMKKKNKRHNVFHQRGTEKIDRTNSKKKSRRSPSLRKKVANGDLIEEVKTVASENSEFEIDEKQSQYDSLPFFAYEGSNLRNKIRDSLT